ncbi:hypothetical protein DFH09DRAFT_1091040 [Mycena vulgaris]|nr:hypothetical protein DFH09DRAFT_1091040 [Mycena vulgaris]
MEICPPGVHLRTITLAFVAAATTLTVDLLTASDAHYLAGYLDTWGAAVETLDLTLAGTPLGQPFHLSIHISFSSDAATDESMLPLFLEPCMALQVLRLHFAAVGDARYFFAFGGAFVGAREEMRLEITVPGFVGMRLRDVIPHAAGDVRLLAS